MSIIGQILKVESGGGHNVTQGNIGDINNQTGDLAQGYFQITGATWRDFGGGSTGYNSALQAPYGTQLAIAQNIPVQRWGPATQAALAQQGYTPQPGETLGAMLKRYGEDPTATAPADGSSAAAGQLAHGPDQTPAFDPATGLPAGTTDAAGAMTQGGTGTGAPLNIGIQGSLVGDIQKWIGGIASGVSSGVSAAFGNIQNWFVRAFLIVVGIVVLAIGIIKLTGHDLGDVVAQLIKVMPAAA